MSPQLLSDPVAYLQIVDAACNVESLHSTLVDSVLNTIKADRSGEMGKLWMAEKTEENAHDRYI